MSYAALVRNVEIFVMPGMIFRDRKRKRGTEGYEDSDDEEEEGNDRRGEKEKPRRLGTIDEESINMGYLSFAVVISVASFTLFGTTLNEASAEPILARWNDNNVAVDLGLGKYNGRGLYPRTAYFI